ncbi:hypothetical protein Tco_0776204 [Tanacetum coccineum]
MTSRREIKPPPGFSAAPTTTTMFATTTPKNTPLAYRVSTSTNPNPVISPDFVEANYETLESLLKDRQRQMRNNDLRTEFKYFSEDYDEEREMDPDGTAGAVTHHFGAVFSQGSKGAAKVEGLRKKHQRTHGLLRILLSGKPSLRGRLLPTSHKRASLPSTFTNGLFPNLLGSVTPFVRWIEDYPLPDGLKMPSHIGSYDRKGDPDNFLHLFEGAIRMQKWLMPVACHMFIYTLKDFARIWWNSKKAGSILDYEDLKAKF